MESGLLIRSCGMTPVKLRSLIFTMGKGARMGSLWRHSHSNLRTRVDQTQV